MYYSNSWSYQNWFERNLRDKVYRNKILLSFAMLDFSFIWGVGPQITREFVGENQVPPFQVPSIFLCSYPVYFVQFPSIKCSVSQYILQVFPVHFVEFTSQLTGTIRSNQERRLVGYHKDTTNLQGFLIKLPLVLNFPASFQ